MHAKSEENRRKPPVFFVRMYWYKEPHWDYDRNKLRFIEISDSKENDGDGIEEPRPGSVIRMTE